MLDVTTKKMEVDRLTRVEEHVADRSRLLVYLEGVAGENNPFGNNARCVRVQESTHGYKLWSYVHAI